MVSVEEPELPGLGWEYTLRGTESGDRFVVILTDAGKRELYRFRPGASEAREVATLTDEECRTLGAILLGAYLPPRPSIPAQA